MNDDRYKGKFYMIRIFANDSMFKIKLFVAGLFMMIMVVVAYPSQGKQLQVSIDLTDPSSYGKQSYRHKENKKTKLYKSFLQDKASSSSTVKELIWSATKTKRRWSPSFLHQRAELWLAAVLFGECRGQDIVCMQMVGNVVMNRARLNLDRRYGRGVWGVLTKKYAFSCLLMSDNSRKVIDKAMAGKLKLHSPDEIKWSVAVGVAHQLMHRGIPDKTKGATLYHAPYVNPKWNRPKYATRTAVGGGHIFYKEKL